MNRPSVSASSSSSTKSASAAISIEALWQFDRLAGLALSPDGQRAVCSVSRADMAANRSRSQLWLLSTCRQQAPRALTHCGDKDGQAAWSPDGKHIAFLSRREQQGSKDESAQLYVMAADGGEARRVSEVAAGVEAFKWMPDGRHIVLIAWVWPELKGLAAQNKRMQEHKANKASGYVTSEAQYRHFDHNVPAGRVAHLLRLELASGRLVDLLEGSGFELPRDNPGADLFDISPDGRRLVFQYDPAPLKRAGQRCALAELNPLRTRRADVRVLLDEPTHDFSTPSFDPKGRGLVAIATPLRPVHTMLGRLARVEADGAWHLIGADADLEPEAPLRWSPAGDAIYFAAQQAGRCHLWRQRLDQGAPELAWRGGWLQGFDLRADADGETVLALAADSLQHPVRIHARRGEGTLLRLEHFNDELLAGLRLGQVQELSLPGALGDPLQMWLVYPPGFKPAGKKKYPVLHVIHGGPYSACGDTFGYRWNPQLLASQGHVVAMVNYHGSSGFGHAFRHSIMGRMGELELQDIEAGTDWLLRQPWVDGSRIYASGGSYGGFMVAWMNGHVAPGRYRAYICHAGVFDRVATWSADSYNQRPRDLGAPYWQEPAKVAAQSPASFAAHMQAPTLISHGALDYRVPDHNGLAYYNTLKARGVPARLLWFPDENHWILKPQNSRQWYREVFDWLAKN
ncbi:S9 family peptidase [Paucibacter sp. AS339]|uniref:S9 family peptidase n=1 Tax=Paucibacter hankyongi TaxID=3133434 RepID=UPI0030B468DF